MIRSFAGGGTEDVFNGVNSAAARKSCPQALWGIARRKLDRVKPAASPLALAGGDKAGILGRR